MVAFAVSVAALAWSHRRSGSATLEWQVPWKPCKVPNDFKSMFRFNIWKMNMNLVSLALIEINTSRV